MNLPCRKSDVVFVIWKDAEEQSARIFNGDISQIALATNCSVGWIAHRNDERLVLARGTSTSGELDILTIAESSVIEIVPLIRKRNKKHNGS